MGVLDQGKVAVIFPGQGSQTVGMGSDLVQNSPTAAAIFEKADQILGFSISKLCFEGPEADLTRTVNTQPALFTCSVAAYEVAKEKGLNASFAAGHSLGEYAALYAAGAISFDDGLRLIRKRAEFMDSAASSSVGAMAAVLGLAPDKVEECVVKVAGSGVVVAANYNSPIQTVVSGEPDAVAKAGELAKEMGAKRVVPLSVSGAFHSPLMQPAADALADVLAKTPVNEAIIPIAANFTGNLENTAEEIKTNLANQVVGTVKWVDCIQCLIEAGTTVFVELGPGNVLAGLVKKISSQVQVFSAGNIDSIEALFA